MNWLEFLLEIGIFCLFGYIYFLYQKSRLIYFQKIEDLIILIDSLPDLSDEEIQFRNELDYHIQTRRKLPKNFLEQESQKNYRSDIIHAIKSSIPL